MGRVQAVAAPKLGRGGTADMWPGLKGCGRGTIALHKLAAKAPPCRRNTRAERNRRPCTLRFLADAYCASGLTYHIVVTFQSVALLRQMSTCSLLDLATCTNPSLPGCTWPGAWRDHRPTSMAWGHYPSTQSPNHRDICTTDPRSLILWTRYDSISRSAV